MTTKANLPENMNSGSLFSPFRSKNPTLPVEKKFVEIIKRMTNQLFIGMSSGTINIYLIYLL